MKKFILLLLSVVGVSIGAFAQAADLSNGYYRVTNAHSDRYIHVLDNKGSLNIQASSADMGAIILKKGIERAISDPASVLYVEKNGSQYDIKAQNTGIYSMIEVFVNLIHSPSVPNAYWAYGKKGSMTMYLWDAKSNMDAEESYLDTRGSSRDWYIYPIDNSTDNYFGVKPTHQAGGKYYAAFYAAFPFSFASSGMKAYYITGVDENQGVAIYKEISGTIPALTPVIIECSSDNPANNKLNIGGSGTAPSGNIGHGVLFELHKYHHDNFVTYNKSTMRTIGLAPDGSIAMTAGDYEDVPKNTFYISVGSSCPSSLKLVNESEYQPGPVQATSVTLDHTNITLYPGETQTISATVAPDNTADKTVTWTSSNPAIASVDAYGKVTAVAPGSATITATCGSVSASCNVTVNPAPVVEATAITLSQTYLSLETGGSASLYATVTPDNTTDKTVTWTSSNPAVASVSSSGYVNALSAGTAIITATCGNVSATCSVTVTDPIIEATSVTLSSTSLFLTPGESQTLTATVAPYNATDKTVTWTSSDTSVATVDAGGTVTAIAQGSARITATCGSVSASCAVTVEIVEASSILLSASSIQINIGEDVVIEATVMPENTTDKTVTWTSSNPGVASVDANGKVTGVAFGTASITASCGVAKARCSVIVTRTQAQSITLNFTELTMYPGDSETLVASVLPAEVADKNVAWSSSDPSVVRVSNSGVVKAIAPGNAVIKAKVDNVETECSVTVLAVEAQGITLSETSIAIKETETFRLIATVMPENTTYNTVTWTTSDPAIATVDAEGLVTAVAEGNAIITATCGNVSAECAVLVNPLNGIYGIIADGETFDVYTISGIKIRSNACSIDDLPHGFYIINGHTVRH